MPDAMREPGWPSPPQATAVGVELSVVIPVHDEAEAIVGLLDEICAVLRGRRRFEILVVDDASADDTLARVQQAMSRIPELRLLSHAHQAGQSAAIRSGVQAARGDWILTLDGDGQNDPADIPRLLDARAAAGPDCRLIGGWRVQRRDGLGKRWASRVANAVRRRLLRDDTPDTGCGIKLFERRAFLDLPYFDHMHRFLPALMQRSGWRTQSIPVSHRPRRAGRSKYGNWGRLWAGVSDLRGVAWLMRRASLPQPREIARNGLEP